MTPHLPVRGLDAATLALIGRLHVEKQAAVPAPCFALAGTLQLAPSGFLLLSVPNALVRGVFAALREPGAELPSYDDGAGLNAHVTVMRPEELAKVGGPDKLTERGKTYHYNLGRLVSAGPSRDRRYSKVWFLKVHSPELQALRRSYGLTGLPGGFDFHVTVAVRRRGVLGHGEERKGG